MRQIIFFISLFYSVYGLCDTQNNPAVLEYLRKQAAESEAETETSSEVTSANKAPASPTASEQGPPRSVSEQEMCTNELRVSYVNTATDKGVVQETCKMQMNEAFANALKVYLPKCARQAAINLRLNPIPTNISIEHLGGFNVRKANTVNGPGNSWSRHSLGKAIDISAIILENGTSKTRIDLTKDTQNQAFYNAFRACWDKSMEEAQYAQYGKNCTCSIGHTHAAYEPANHKHDDHMHLSLSCPAQTNVVGC